MLKGFFLFILLTSSVFATTGNADRLSNITNIKKFAFGSCNDQNDKQPLWKDLLSVRPDLFIWGGDVIYADWERKYDIKGSYEKQNKNADYARFKELTPITGIWDDHDFAKDNANGTFEHKNDSKSLFLEFLEEPEKSVRREREGIYHSMEYGEEGKKIKFILLDNRFFKDLEKGAPLLGEEQWKWFEEELKNSKAQLHFIMSGISIFSPAMPVQTSAWGNYPQELKRLKDLIKKYNPPGVTFLTGDMHFATIFQRDGYLEFLSSGMTHVTPKSTWWYLRRKYPNTYFGLNYGLVDIDWDNSTPIITLSIRTINGSDVNKQKYKWDTNIWKRISF